MVVAWEIINRTLSREEHSGFDTVRGRCNLSAAASVVTNNGFSASHPEENDLFTWCISPCCANYWRRSKDHDRIMVASK
uniref:Uncharacterized protein n=1 Tax=Salmo trutta TaxID=8032 RepID=A0A673XB35_SALTR